MFNSRYIGLFLLTLWSPFALAAEGELSPIPLSMDVQEFSQSNSRIPNIMLLLDNSGSMCENIFFSFFSRNCAFREKDSKMHQLKEALAGRDRLLDALVAQKDADNLPEVRLGLARFPVPEDDQVNFFGRITESGADAEILVPIRKLDDNVTFNLRNYQCKQYEIGAPVTDWIPISSVQKEFLPIRFFKRFLGNFITFSKPKPPTYEFYCPTVQGSQTAIFCPDQKSGVYANGNYGATPTFAGYSNATDCRLRKPQCEENACYQRNKFDCANILPNVTFPPCRMAKRFRSFFLGDRNLKVCNIVRSPGQVDCVKQNGKYFNANKKDVWEDLGSSSKVKNVAEYMKEKIYAMTAEGGTPLAKSLAEIGVYYTAYLTDRDNTFAPALGKTLIIHPDSDTQSTMTVGQFFDNQVPKMDKGGADIIKKTISSQYVEEKTIPDPGNLISRDVDTTTEVVPIHLLTFSGYIPETLSPLKRCRGPFDGGCNQFFFRNFRGKCFFPSKKCEIPQIKHTYVESRAHQQCIDAAIKKSLQPELNGLTVKCEWKPQANADSNWSLNSNHDAAYWGDIDGVTDGANTTGWHYFYDEADNTFKKANRDTNRGFFREIFRTVSPVNFFRNNGYYYGIYDAVTNLYNPVLKTTEKVGNFFPFCRKGLFQGLISNFGPFSGLRNDFSNNRFKPFNSPFVCKPDTVTFSYEADVILGYVERFLTVTRKVSSQSIDGIAINRPQNPSVCVASNRAASNNHVILLSDGDSTGDDGLLSRELRDYIVGRSRFFKRLPFIRLFFSNDSSYDVIDVANALYDIDLQPGGLDETLENARTHTISFGSKWNGWFDWSSSGIMENAAAAGGGFWGRAGNDEDLFNTFKKIIRSTEGNRNAIQGLEKASFAPPAFNKNRATADTVAYQPLFRSFPWRGDVEAYQFSRVVKKSDNGTPNDHTDDQEYVTFEYLQEPPNGKDPFLWSARVVLQTMDKSTRKILTSQNGTAVEFSFNNLSGIAKADIELIATSFGNINADEVGIPAAELLILKQAEQMNAIVLQDLGDVVHASPVFHNDILYVAANDGMLHAFDARPESTFAAHTECLREQEADPTVQCDDKVHRRELFAYIPEGVFSIDNGKGLHYLSDPEYLHRYYLDMTPSIVKVGDRTLLVVTLGGGGSSIFALDLDRIDAANFDSDQIGASSILWEKSFAEGLSFSLPQLTKMGDREVMLVGSGFPESLSTSVAKVSSDLHIFNPITGAENALSFDISDAPDANGLGTPTVVDEDNDGKGDRAYVADLSGNLYVFDKNRNVKLLYDGADNQIITTKPAVARHPSGGFMVLFGTGSYIWQGDERSTEQEYFIGLHDAEADVARVVPTTENDLESQLVQIKLTVVSPDGTVIPDEKVNENTDADEDFTAFIVADAVEPQPTTPKGWFIKLIRDNSTDKPSERVVYNPRVIKNRIITFVTVRPQNQNQCNRGGFSRFLGLQTTDGLLSSAIFDLNGDGIIDERDLVNGKPVVGFGLDEVFSDTSSVDTKKGVDFYGTKQNGSPAMASAHLGNNLTRTSWREIRAGAAGSGK